MGGGVTEKVRNFQPDFHVFFKHCNIFFRYFRFLGLVSFLKTVSRFVWRGLDREEFPSGEGDVQAGRGQDWRRVEVEAGDDSNQGRGPSRGEFQIEERSRQGQV